MYVCFCKSSAVENTIKIDIKLELSKSNHTNKALHLRKKEERSFLSETNTKQ